MFKAIRKLWTPSDRISATPPSRIPPWVGSSFPSPPSGFVKTRTGNPCGCCCPGMHDSLHNHPPPVLLFSIDMGGLWSPCTGLSGYLIGNLTRQTGFLATHLGYLGTTPCIDFPCPASTGSGACALSWTCTQITNNSNTCAPSVSFLPWECNNFCCNCICTYSAAMNSTGTAFAATPDPTYVSPVVSFGCVGSLGNIRGACLKLSQAKCDFQASISKSFLSTFCPLGSTTCPMCNACGPSGNPAHAACDATYGVGQWLNSCQYCNEGAGLCDSLYGSGNWQNDYFTASTEWFFQTNCADTPDAIIGCNPCPYCDWEKDDCDESGDTAGGTPQQASSYTAPCNPCAWPKTTVSPFAPPGDFDNCNPKFSAFLQGPCGSSITITTP